MLKTELRWGVKAYKNCDSKMWSFGICLTLCYDEKFLFINLGKYDISIGKMYLEVKK